MGKRVKEFRGLGFRVYKGLWFRSLGFRVWGLGFKSLGVWGLGFIRV